MANKKEMSSRRGAARVILVILASYSALAALILIIFGRLIPSPLADYTAFAYISARIEGKYLLSTIFALLWLASVILAFIAGILKRALPLPWKIVSALLAAADLILNIAAFLAPRGAVDWGYLISATLDGAMILAVSR